MQFALSCDSEPLCTTFCEPGVIAVQFGTADGAGAGGGGGVGAGGGVLPAASVNALPENVPVTPLKFSLTEQVSVLSLLIVHVAGTVPLVCAEAVGVGGASAATASIVDNDAARDRSVGF